MVLCIVSRLLKWEVWSLIQACSETVHLQRYGIMHCVKAFEVGRDLVSHSGKQNKCHASVVDSGGGHHPGSDGESPRAALQPIASQRALPICTKDGGSCN